MAESSPPLEAGAKEVEAGLSSPPPALPLAADLTEDEAIVENAKETNVAVAFAGLILCLFLAALDQTIIATALPSIAADLNASASEYSWVGTSYLLLTTTLTPCYGRLSDLIGRKVIMYISIVIFIFGSALCGSAKTMIWLISARAVQGIGGGGIMSMSTIIVGDIVPMKDRGTYQGLMGGVWGVSSVLGPLIGGVLSDKASWRWCFFMNLPTCGVAIAVLFFFLKIDNQKRATWPEFRDAFDFIGLGLMVVALGCLVVGFAEATDFGFDFPAAIALIVVGVVVLVLAVLHFLNTKKRKGILPRAVFLNRTTALSLVSSYLQAFSFLSTTFYLPIFFQAVKGTSALMSGINMLPFSLTVSVVSLPTGLWISKYGHVRTPIRVGYLVACLGFGLMNLMNESSHTAMNLLFPLIVGAGVGLSLQPPLLIIQASLPQADMAAGTSSFLVLRSLGATTGISTSGAILSTTLKSRLSKIPGYTFVGVPTSTDEYRALHEVLPLSVRKTVLHEFSLALTTLFKVFAPFLGACFLISLCLKHYHLDRANVPKEKKSRPSSPSPSPTSPLPLSSLPLSPSETKDGLDSIEHQPSYSATSTLFRDPNSPKEGEWGIDHLAPATTKI